MSLKAKLADNGATYWWRVTRLHLDEGFPTPSSGLLTFFPSRPRRAPDRRSTLVHSRIVLSSKHHECRCAGICRRELSRWQPATVPISKLYGVEGGTAPDASRRAASTVEHLPPAHDRFKVTFRPHHRC